MQSNTTTNTEDEFISEVEDAFNESNEDDKPTKEILNLAVKAVPIIAKSFDLSNLSVDAWCGCVEYWAGAIRGPVTYCDTFMNLEFGEQGGRRIRQGRNRIQERPRNDGPHQADATH